MPFLFRQMQQLARDCVRGDKEVLTPSSLIDFVEKREDFRIERHPSGLYKSIIKSLKNWLDVSTATKATCRFHCSTCNQDLEKFSITLLPVYLATDSFVEYLEALLTGKFIPYKSLNCTCGTSCSSQLSKSN